MLLLFLNFETTIALALAYGAGAALDVDRLPAGHCTTLHSVFVRLATPAPPSSCSLTWVLPGSLPLQILDHWLPSWCRVERAFTCPGMWPHSCFSNRHCDQYSV